MASTSSLVQQKLDQAVEILREQDVDLWLTYVRETMLTSDPCLDLIAGTYSAWTGAFMVSATGERIAPRSIALNYSRSDSAADGLTHGLWLELQETLSETPFPERFRSSEAIVN